MENNILEFFEEIRNKFVSYLKTITNNKYENQLENMKNEKIMMLFFILKMNNDEKKYHIDDMIEKMKIEKTDEIMMKMNEYYDCFLDIKKMIIKQKSVEIKVD